MPWVDFLPAGLRRTHLLSHDCHTPFPSPSGTPADQQISCLFQCLVVKLPPRVEWGSGNSFVMPIQCLVTAPLDTPAAFST